MADNSMGDYRIDPDLEFLGQVKSEDLTALVNCLIYTPKNKPRKFETLTSKYSYVRYNPDHHKYWWEIAAEIQRCGGNSFANIYRAGKGPLYKSILQDVCAKINFTKTQNISSKATNFIKTMYFKFDGDFNKLTTSELEDLLLQNILGHGLNKMSDTEFHEFLSKFNASNIQEFQLMLPSITAAIVGLGLIGGPVGLISSGLFVAAHPTYSVVIPAIIQVILLRQKYQDIPSDEDSASATTNTNEDNSANFNDTEQEEFTDAEFEDKTE